MERENREWNAEQFERTARLLGETGVEKLHKSCVAVFGLGGVGSFAAEALARSGVGRLLLIDGDTVQPSNLNRQLFALYDTLGVPKTEAAAARIASFSPARVETYTLRYGESTRDAVPLGGCDYIIDAVDDVAAKLLLVEQARALGVPIICSMGAGNKLDPTAFRVGNIEETSVCPLARVMRRELKKRGVTGVRVVYSTEPPLPANGPGPGSVAFVPSVAGLILAGEVIKTLTRT